MKGQYFFGEEGLTILAFYCSLVVVCFALISVYNYFYPPPACEINGVVTNIYSLDGQQQNELRGTFVLGTGTISSGSKSYYYIYAEKAGGKILQRLDASDWVIYETDDVSPKMVKEEYLQLRCKGSLMLLNKLYIPKNSIRQEFKPN